MSGRANHRAGKDIRNPRVPLEKPPFGPPARAAHCGLCDNWYPWKAFYRRNHKPGKAGSHYTRCLNCREAAGWRPPTPRGSKPRTLPVTSPADDLIRQLQAEKHRTD